MAYRMLEVKLRVGADSSLSDGDTASVGALITQPKDLEYCDKSFRVGPSDSDVSVNISPVTTGYFYAIYADYPVKVRINGSSATQLTGHSNNVAATNQGAPLPYQFFACATAEVTSIYIAPIDSAAQTARVRVVVTGDPESAYI